MNKYVLCKFSVAFNDKIEKAWCLCKVYTINKKASIRNDIYEFRIKKLLKTSSNFDKVYGVEDDDEDINAAYVPHLKKDGKLYINVHLDTDNDGIGKDEVLEFENDEDAILYAELGGNNG